MICQYDGDVDTSVQIDRSWVVVVGGPEVVVKRRSLRNSVASGGRSVVVGHGSPSIGLVLMLCRLRPRTD